MIDLCILNSLFFHKVSILNSRLKLKSESALALLPLVVEFGEKILDARCRNFPPNVRKLITCRHEIDVVQKLVNTNLVVNAIMVIKVLNVVSTHRDEVYESGVHRAILTFIRFVPPVGDTVVDRPGFNVSWYVLNYVRGPHRLAFDDIL